MNEVTICMAFYCNAGMLQIQYGNLAAQSETVKQHIRYIVVDDGSPTGKAEPPTRDIGVPVEIYRAKEDIPWNQDWARNLGVHQAKTKWVLLTDMDHVPSVQLLERLVNDEKVFEDCVYTFRRKNAPNLEPYKPHPNSWFMTKKMYERIGGYDERYRGIYGTDGMFARRAQRNARKIMEFKEALIRYPRDVVPDASTTTLTRRSEENEAKRHALRKHLGEGDAPVRFLTEWDRVA